MGRLPALKGVTMSTKLVLSVRGNGALQTHTSPGVVCQSLLALCRWNPDFQPRGGALQGADGTRLLPDLVLCLEAGRGEVEEKGWPKFRPKFTPLHLCKMHSLAASQSQLWVQIQSSAARSQASSSPSCR